MISKVKFNYLCLAITPLLFLTCKNLFADDFEDTELLPIILNADSFYVKYETNSIDESKLENYYGPEKNASKRFSVKLYNFLFKRKIGYKLISKRSKINNNNLEFYQNQILYKQSLREYNYWKPYFETKLGVNEKSQ